MHHLTAVVFILVVPGVTKGNLEIFHQSTETHNWQRRTFESCNSFSEPIHSSACRNESVTDAYFIALNVLCCVFWFSDANSCCSFSFLPSFLSQRLGMQLTVQHRKWVLWEAREVQVLQRPPDSCVDDTVYSVEPCGALATLFPYIFGAVNVPIENHNPTNWIQFCSFLDLFGTCCCVKSTAKSALCLNSKKALLY